MTMLSVISSSRYEGLQPLDSSTRHMFDARAFSRMKPSAILVNTSRGPIIDEAALVAALESRTIAGAALDVYEREPEVHPGLLGRDDVVLAPHIASATVETRTRMATMALENARAVLAGERPPNAVNDPVDDGGGTASGPGRTSRS